MKVGVLMGGISSEREISLLSGNEIDKNLNKNKYEAYPIVIDSKDEVIEKVKGMDFIFIALHGAFGEDGTVQALLECAGVPYSGCNVLTSAICMSKKQTKRILKAEGIDVAPAFTVYKNDGINFEQLETLGYPMVVKPNNGGSSIGTFLVTNQEQLKEGITEALKYDNQVLIEKYLRGSEYTAPVLNGEAFPILSIKANMGNFFDYTSKYADGGAQEIVADLPQELDNKIKKVAEKCWKIFDCKAYMRVDIIVSEGVPYVLELNTLPGMTRNSLFPKSAHAVGMEYSALLDNIIKYSLD